MPTDPTVENALIDVAIQDAMAAPSPLAALKEAFNSDLGEGVSATGSEFDITNRERIAVYSNLDGKRSDVLKINLGQVLKKKFQAKSWIPQSMWGKAVFTLTEPADSGALKLLCYLHADHPRRAELNKLGLLGHVCQKANIASQYELERHMEKKHKAEWRTVEKAEQDAKAAQAERIALLQLEAFKAISDRKEK